MHKKGKENRAVSVHFKERGEKKVSIKPVCFYTLLDLGFLNLKKCGCLGENVRGNNSNHVDYNLNISHSFSPNLDEIYISFLS